MTTTLQIMPPELLGSASTTTEAKPFDSMEMLPNKLGAGESVELRILGTFSSGHIAYLFRCPVEEQQSDGTLRFAGYDFGTDYNGFPNAARATDWSSSDRRKLDEQVKPKRCLSMLVWNYATDRIEVAHLEQKSLREALVEIASDEDYSWDSEGIANFTIKVGRQGTGLETSYSLLPKAGKKVEAKVAKAFEAVRETATMDTLLKGQHPLRKPKAAAEFNSEPVEAEF